MRILANWMADGNSFRFNENSPGSPQIWKYDPVQAKRVPLLEKGHSTT